MFFMFLLMLVPSSLQEPETSRNVQDPCNELKQLRELVSKQAVALAEIKVKMEYMEKENAGEAKMVTLPSVTLAAASVAVYTVSGPGRTVGILKL